MKSNLLTPRIIFIGSVILVAALSRLFPHIPNFTPIAAMALFGGVYFKNKIWGIIVPLIAMIISDVGLEFTTGWGFHNTIPYVYTSFIATSLIGYSMKNKTNVPTIAGASLVSSLLFFIVTNFGVWAAGGFIGGAAGLTTTYIIGIPYFGATMLGDLFFNGILFGTFYFAKRRFPVLVKA